jgi:hypothetical protein
MKKLNILLTTGRVAKMKFHIILMFGVLAFVLSGCGEPDWKNTCAKWSAGDVEAQETIDDEIGASAQAIAACEKEEQDLRKLNAREAAASAGAVTDLYRVGVDCEDYFGELKSGYTHQKKAYDEAWGKSMNGFCSHYR